MNKIYISPSQQGNNKGYGDYGTEQKRMFQIGEALKIILIRCNQTVYISKKGMTFQQAVTESNKLDADIHLPIHSNAFNSLIRGTLAMYVSNGGKSLSSAIYKRLSAFTLVVDRGCREKTNLYELNATHAVCAYLEIMFHDNGDDANLIINNIEKIAELIAKGVCEYLKIPFIEKPAIKINIVLETQKFLNSLWVTDAKGNELLKDGIMGANTQYAIDKLRRALNE